MAAVGTKPQIVGDGKALRSSQSTRGVCTHSLIRLTVDFDFSSCFRI